MNYGRRLLASLLALVIFNNFSPAALGCGPSSIDPVFVFKGSPDPPFNEFAGGRIGIVQPELGRKTLVIAYRYLNDRAFGDEEQAALVEALEGKAPEDNGDDAVKKWIAARKGLAKEGETLPEIYAERRFGGYDFFPNCTRNAFEVATETLKNRTGSYGADDQNVRAWLAAQDIVFQNCGGGASIPAELGFESPEWLRQDRDYQIAAALLYSLNFDEARARFEKIAADLTSPWQQTADYVVARTLVRQASFAKDEARKRALYEQAETHLNILLAKGGKFSNASQRLLGLVTYRMRPEQRVGELGKILADGNGNENIRQDLIDYVWLLDKFEAQIWQAEAIRKAAEQPLAPEEGPTPPPLDDDIAQRAAARREAIDRGELIDLGVEVKNSNGSDYATWVQIDFKYDAPEDEIFRAFETHLRRNLTPDETRQLKERRALALSHRKWMMSPNQKWAYEDYEGSYQRGDELSPQMLPVFLRSDELTDWLFTFKTGDQRAYAHAFSKWRAGGSSAWLLAALTKSNATSRGLASLLRAAERISRDAPAFPSVAYQVVRLNVALGRKTEARKLLDEILDLPPQAMSVSAENILREQRTALAANVSEFLKFAQRRPVTFVSEGSYGKMGHFFNIEKEYWYEGYGETKEEFERKLADRFRELLLWDDRFAFDEETVEVFNWHFPLPVLIEAARDRAVPDYLRRRLLLTAWTRAVLLKNEKIAPEAVREVVKLAPELSSTFDAYLDAATDEERRKTALYILLRQPSLSPYVVGGLPDLSTAEGLDYYFESSWWCTPSNTVFNDDGQEVMMVVPRPAFLTPEQLAAATRERAALIAIGDGKSYLGKRVLEWARTSPADERMPEALYIAARANSQYKYGCQSWEYDHPTKEAAEKLLQEKYPRSPWTAKLEPPN